VSDIAHFVKAGTLWHLFLWPTGSESHYTFCERQSHHGQQIVSDIHCTLCEGHSHHIFSYDKQGVSDIAHVLKGSLTTSFPYEQQGVSQIIAHFVKCSLILWPIGSEWHCTFCESFITSFPMTNSLWVTLHTYFVKGSLITFPMTGNRKWVIWQIC